MSMQADFDRLLGRVVGLRQEISGSFMPMQDGVIVERYKSLPFPMSLMMGIYWAVFGWKALLILSTEKGLSLLLDEAVLDSPAELGVTKKQISQEICDIFIGLLCDHQDVILFLLREKSRPIDLMVKNALISLDGALLFGQNPHAQARIVENYLYAHMYMHKELRESVTAYALYGIEKIDPELSDGDLVRDADVFCDTSMQYPLLNAFSLIWVEDLKNPQSLLHYQIKILCEDHR